MLNFRFKALPNEKLRLGHVAFCLSYGDNFTNFFFYLSHTSIIYGLKVIRCNICTLLVFLEAY
jgi:hypothetical protein